ncbi:macro domain-containing protein [Guggenheimella bovis]
MPFEVIHTDITTLAVDAIVNAANTSLLMGGGVCGAIFRSAGIEKLERACRSLAPIQTGEAVITEGFNLKASHVIHTAGPIYEASNANECRRLLASSYENSLRLAYEKGLKSIAFPLISSGIYGYPKEEAFEVAKNTIEDFLKTHDMDVFLVLFP